MTVELRRSGIGALVLGRRVGRPGTLITYFERDPAEARRARMGVGQTHHFALAVATDEEQLANGASAS